MRIPDPRTAYTNEAGKPFERPTAPAPDGTTEEHIAWIRALHAYHDAITDCANRAFDDQFRK